MTISLHPDGHSAHSLPAASLPVGVQPSTCVSASGSRRLHIQGQGVEQEQAFHVLCTAQTFAVTMPKGAI